jgi:hypothetical protein
MPAKLKRVRPGMPVTAASYNALVDAVNALAGVSGALPIEVRHHPGGTVISLAYQEKEAVCELLAAMSAGGSAAAKLLAHDGVSWVDADTAEITVHDAIGSFEFNPGDRVLARFNRQAGLWNDWNGAC